MKYNHNYNLFWLTCTTISLHLLEPGGSLTALVPRSFFNGTYHKPFRRYLKTIASIDVITRYRSRSNLFKVDNVLMENVIVRFTKGPQKGLIDVYTCDCPDTPASSTMRLPVERLLNNDNDIFVLPADEDELNAFSRVTDNTYSLEELGIRFSTGKLVASRYRDELNFDGQGVQFIDAKCTDTTGPVFKVKASSRSVGSHLVVNEKTSKALSPAQNMILMKRISSNSDKKRMHCVLLEKNQCESDHVALSNHLQVLTGERLEDPRYASMLQDYLRSEDVELAMRAINGTTQINADDMKFIRLPERFR